MDHPLCRECAAALRKELEQQVRLAVAARCVVTPCSRHRRGAIDCAGRAGLRRVRNTACRAAGGAGRRRSCRRVRARDAAGAMLTRCWRPCLLSPTQAELFLAARSSKLRQRRRRRCLHATRRRCAQPKPSWLLRRRGRASWTKRSSRTSATSRSSSCNAPHWRMMLRRWRPAFEPQMHRHVAAPHANALARGLCSFCDAC